MRRRDDQHRQMLDSGESQGDRRASGIPSITIERTLVNDLCVILSLIAPTRQVAAGLADPATFLEQYAPELEMAARLIRARVESFEAAGAVAPPSGPARSPDAARERIASAPRQSQNLGSLLR
jgi:hypothetical protein